MSVNQNASQTCSRRDFVKSAAVASALPALAACAAPMAVQASEAPASAGERRVVTGSANGRHPIVVKVALDGNTIESIQVVKQFETELIAGTALSRIPEMIVKNQSLDVDAVAGATMTSFGVRLAVENALEQAGITASDLANTGSDQGILVEEPVEADIAVVGGGLAGLACAARLLQNGKNVVVFEESGHLGGSAIGSYGFCSGCGAQMQKAAGVEDTPEGYYDYIQQITEENYGLTVERPEIVHRYTQMNAEAFDWLDSYINMDFTSRVPGPGAYEAPNVNRVWAVNNYGNVMCMPFIDIVQQGVAEGRCSLVLEARVTKLLQSDAGEVTGVEVTYADGTVREYPYGSVVLCTGGYCSNEDVLREYAGYENCCTVSPSTSSGHGIELAKDAGAQLVLMDQRPSYGNGIRDAGFESRYIATITSSAGCFWVTSEGVRAVREDSRYNESQKLWNNAPGNVGYVIFSDAQNNGTWCPVSNAGFHEGSLTPQQSWDKLAAYIEQGEVAWSAQTPRELAEKAGIDPDAFCATYEAFQGYCADGVDPDFGREAGLEPQSGTLYAIKTVPYILMGSGGVKVDVDGRVLGENDEAIPNLYAAGEALGYRQYAGCVRAGNGLTGAVAWGYQVANLLSE